MNGFSALHATLQGMGFRQLLPAFVACIAYAVAQGRLASPIGRRWAWGTVVLSAVAFTALSKPWENGAVLVACGLAGMGLFNAAVWLVSRMIGFRANATSVPTTVAPDPAPQPADAPREAAPISAHGATP